MRGNSVGHRYIIRTRPFILSIFLILLIFEDVISHLIRPIQLYDEFLAIILTLYYIAHVIRRGKIRRKDGLIVLIVIALLTIGFRGNFNSKIQNNSILCIYDAFNIFKFIGAILGAQLIFDHYRFKELLIEYTSFMVKLAVAISTICMILNFFANIGMHTDYRYGMRAYNFLYSRVGDFYNACVLWIIILTASLYYRNSKNTKLFIVLALINMCATLRSRAWGYALLFVILYYALIIRKEGKFRWWYMAAFAAMVSFISADQFSYYFSGNRARKVLLKYGFITAINYFPLGSGFATYGTAIAQRHYSKLYQIYNFSLYWGLSPDRRSFLTDNFWRAVMAEMGFIGAVLMAILLCIVASKFLRVTDNKYSKVCVYFGLGTLFLSSLIASSFFSCTPLMIIMCVIVRTVPNA